MDVNKQFVFVLVSCISLFTFGQKVKYPRETIYVKYEKKTGNTKLRNWKYKGKSGISFSIKESKEKYMTLFYSKEEKADTLCSLSLKNYDFLNLKEIRKRHYNWIFNPKDGIKRPPLNKNAVFVTYLIEIISKDFFVKYPVIWRNEGVID